MWQLLALALPQQRRALALAIGLGALASVADVASLALIKPAIGGVIATTAQTTQAPLATFMAAAIAAAALRLAAIRQTVSAQYGLTSSLAIASFERLQKQDYPDFLRDGASRGFAAFDRLQVLSFQVLAPIIAALTAVCSLLLLLAGLLAIEPWAAVFFALLALAVAGGTARQHRGRSASGLSRLTDLRGKLLSVGRTGFRYVFLTNGQDRLVSDFAEIDRDLAGRRMNDVIAAQSARHSLEMAGLGAALIGLVVLELAGEANSNLLPALGIWALAGLRMLPHLAALRSAAHMISSHGEVTEDVLRLLAEPLPPRFASDASAPRGPIRLERVTVRREGRPDPLRELSLDIPQGARIGIAGASGSGKSTLLDLLAGAIPADTGTVRIGGAPLDRAAGQAWRERIGFVSQNPVLLGGSLRDAVIFPDRLAEVDTSRFDAAVRLAGLGAMAAKFAQGLDTPIGEATEQLSGGQRQRLALAHALYRARDLLLLDEATGQLDQASEAELIATIDALPRDLTIVLVSHRPAMFACCDRVYELRQGQLHELDGAKAAHRVELAS